MNRDDAGPGRAAHRLLVPGLVFIGMVVAVVGSLGAPLVPLVAAVNHVSVDDAQWSLTITFLVGAVATPTIGRLGDGQYRKPVLLVGLVIVAIGGALAALPLGFPTLLGGRAAQGVGLGLTPLTLTVARDALPPERARPAMAILSITTVAGIGLGYPLVALIAETCGLRVAFWFGVAIAVAALLAAMVVVPSSRHRPATRLDLAGASTLGIALAGLLLAISEGGRWGWASARLLGTVAVAIAMLAGWVGLELRSDHPLVDVRRLRHIVVLTADVCAVFTGVGMYLLTSTVTRLVQTPTSVGYGLGASVAVAGLMLTPFSVGTIAASSITRALIRRMAPGRVLSLAASVLLAGMVMFALAHDTFVEIAVVMAIAGLGIGAIFAVMPGFIVQSVPARETGSALSFNQVLRYVGYGIGSSASAAILQAHTRPGASFPADRGYTAVAVASCFMWVLTAASSVFLPWLGGRRFGLSPAQEAIVEEREAIVEEEEQDLESLALAVPGDAGRPGAAGEQTDTGRPGERR
ncbi:MFS transporter [Frankia sp. AiPs1]|uniref:MFS transporter n=1 Tax=Frankia sp. AiPs1 TaxID=573493 RepID=UPI0020449A2B|nr:MFS transporter [Frankia sp. AiPs1]MCM3920830.1 MFS transporter [Frankia sp. AiPs1]